MNITSQFFLTHYIGSESLNLMSMPSQFNNDVKLKAEYNRFLEGINTIYGSQKSNGTIPVFWTMYSGNKYVPNPDSTLEFLDPKESYYFIVRDDSYLPITLPMVGHSLPGYTDSNVLPVIQATGSTILDNIGENYAYLQFKVSGLQPYEDYSYSFNGVSSNWPSTISPKSGLLKPSDDNLELDCVLTFCSNQSSCESANNLLDYNLDTHGISLNNLYSIINLEISPLSYSGESIISDNYGVHCDDCLPRLTVSLPDLGVLTATSSSGNMTPVDGDNRFYTFEATVSGLEPNQIYYYNYRGLASKWPTIIMTPTSGTIKAVSNVSKIKSTISFCVNSGVCPSGTRGLLSYNSPSTFDKNNLFTSIDLSVYKTGNSQDPTISNPLTVYCQDCL